MKKIMILVSMMILALVLVACTDITTTITTLLSTTSATTESSTTTSASTTTTTTTTTTTETTTTTTIPEDTAIVLKDTKNFILASVGESVDLSEYIYKGAFGEIPMNEGVFSDFPASVTVSDGHLVATAKGMFSLTFTVGETSVPINLFTKLAEETEYVIYSAAFDGLVNGTLPEGYTINTGTAYISNGKLLVDGRATTPSRVLLPSYLNGFKNYIIETDFTILSTNEPTRWASVMFRFGSAGYFQMAIRQGATATNGVEFAKWVNGGWNVPKTTSLSAPISSSTNYRLKIDLKGDVVKEYINVSSIYSLTTSPFKSIFKR